MFRHAGLAALTAAAVLAAAPAALADTLRVPSQYETIQEAVDAAGDGDTVVISAGTYTEDVDVTAKTDLTIRGSGRVVLAPGSSIYVSGSSTGILVRSLTFENGAITVIGGGDVTLTRLTFNGGVTAVGSAGVAGLAISRCTFLGHIGSAVSDIDSTGFVVEKCRFEAIGGYAVILSPDNGVGTQSPVLSKNRVAEAAGGFALSGANALVEKNRMEGLAGRGVETTGFLGTQGAVISKNRITTTGDDAIGGAYNGFLVEKNVLVGGGITFSGSNHVIDRNRVTGAAGGGIITSNANCTVRDNTVNGTGGVGILVDGDASVVEGNTVTDADGNGIEVFAGGCDVLGNTVLRSDANGILVAGTGHFVAGNRSSGNGLNDLADFSAEGVNTYEDNRFGTVLFNYFD